VDWRWMGGGREEVGRWTAGGWEVDAASVYGYIMSKQSRRRCVKIRRIKAKTFRHEEFPGDSSA
jgi:hypothetical protein